jgi:hypothetical protein
MTDMLSPVLLALKQGHHLSFWAIAIGLISFCQSSTSVCLGRDYPGLCILLYHSYFGSS